MTYEAILPQHIDSTMISCFRSCQTKFKYEFVYGLRPSNLSIDLHAGGVFASALEYFQRLVHEKRVYVADAVYDTIRFMIDEWKDFPTPQRSAKTLDNMVLAFRDYVLTYPPGTDHVQPFKNDKGETTYEFSAAVPLDPADGFPLHPVTGEPFVYCGRFDLLGAYNGRPCIRDEKTAGQAGEGWSEKWDLRSQFMGYCWLGQQSGITDLDTVVVRGVIVQKTKITQLEAIKIYPQFMIDRWYHQLKCDLTNIVLAWNGGYFEMNLADACTSYGRCPFSSCCSAQVPENWFGEYHVRRWNPLRHNPIGEQSVDTPPVSAADEMIADALARRAAS